MHFSAGAPTTDMEPVNTLLSADTMRIIAQQQDIENTRRHIHKIQIQDINTLWSWEQNITLQIKVFLQILLNQESRRMKTV